MLRRSKDDAKEESSSSASTEGVGDRKEAFVLDGCRRKLGLAGGGTSLQGTCVITVKSKRADDEGDCESGMKSENKPSSESKNKQPLSLTSAATNGPPAVGTR